MNAMDLLTSQAALDMNVVGRTCPEYAAQESQEAQGSLQHLAVTRSLICWLADPKTKNLQHSVKYRETHLKPCNQLLQQQTHSSQLQPNFLGLKPRLQFSYRQEQVMHLPSISPTIYGYHHSKCLMQEQAAADFRALCAADGVNLIEAQRSLSAGGEGCPCTDHG